MIKITAKIGFVFVIFLALVGINSAAFRLLSTTALLGSPATLDVDDTNSFEYFDARYEARPYLTLVHVVSGIVFMVLGPLQFMPSIRRRWLWLHRVSGRVFVAASFVSVISALAIVPMLPVFGSFSSAVGVVLASLLFLVSLVLAVYHILQRNIARHREWMIRTFAIGLGISTFRVFLPILVSSLFDVSFQEAWDTVVWLGFAINILVAEIWINVTRPTPAKSVRAEEPKTLMQAQ